MDHALALYMREADAARALTGWHHFSAWNDIMAATLKMCSQIENPTPSIDEYLLKEHSCQNFIPIGFETTEL